MILTKNIDGVSHTYYALYDTLQSGDYEDDVLYHRWLTDGEAAELNQALSLNGSNCRWVREEVEPEEHDDTPSLEDIGYEAIPAP